MKVEIDQGKLEWCARKMSEAVAHIELGQDTENWVCVSRGMVMLAWVLEQQKIMAKAPSKACQC